MRIPMKTIATNLPGVLLLEPRVFGDDRGFFLESYNQRTFAELGIPAFACTPDLFPELMATAIMRQDLSSWAARHELALG